MNSRSTKRLPYKLVLLPDPAVHARQHGQTCQKANDAATSLDVPSKGRATKIRHVKFVLSSNPPKDCSISRTAVVGAGSWLAGLRIKEQAAAVSMATCRRKGSLAAWSSVIVGRKREAEVTEGGVANEG
ncbi:hypothetical protein CSHISOI_00685 [Colletotrichum shisoi]|uniref:Uncharacterized protein n=1 Tax=Colletotrichum shisoi TaxID=2078593 RepID=A0A5Q4C470_9PEZI|nr:hypothetical protein CSHISOI_00685 [Colletotrichum shisoi]